ncbi:MAG: hypothetical protein ACRDIL_16545 [Candidatus Limnocylindrales bacterium]
MSTATSRRHIRWAAAIAALAFLIAGCAGSAAASAPGASAPASVDPGPAIDTDVLIADAAARDGRPVEVTGFFLATDGVAQLCSLVLESLPPQCGGGTVRLSGTVPAEVLDRLDSTDEPGLAQATWGWVVVTGTFRMVGVDGQPTVELTDIDVAEG